MTFNKNERIITLKKCTQGNKKAKKGDMFLNLLITYIWKYQEMMKLRKGYFGMEKINQMKTLHLHTYIFIQRHR